VILLLVSMNTSTNTMANIVAACGGVATLITAIALLITSLRSNRETKATLADVKQTTDVTHTIVNQQKTDADRWNIALTEHGKALTALLDAAGIDHPSLPIDQSKPVLGERDAQPGQPTV
jgi:hypothetical protein